MKSTTISESTLKKFHLAAAIGHGIEAIGGFTFTNLYPDKGLFTITNDVNVSQLPDDKGFVHSVVNNKVQMGQFISAFPALSMLNHIWALYDWKNYMNYVDHEKNNPVRWAEYSVSAGIMTMAISLLSGQSDIKSLLQLLLSNVVMQQFGNLVEKDVAEASKTKTIHLFKKIRGRAVTHEVMGFILFISIWSSLFVSFFTSLNQTQNYNTSVPPIVYAIIFVLFTFFLLFGLVSCIQVNSLFSKSSSSSSWWAQKDFRKIELMYLILSFLSKSSLFGLVFGGVIFS